MADPLSPAAQAVRNAIKALWDSSAGLPTIEEVAAAAICAAADQVVPEYDWPVSMMLPVYVAEIKKQRAIRGELHAIAAELEGRDG